TFDGYEFVKMDENSAPANGEVKKGDQHVTYVYKKVKTPDPEKEYKVTHEFKSGTPGKELPKEVTDLKPADQTGKKDGEKVTPTQPEKTEVPVKGGKWVFKGYDEKDATINKADKNFVGKWVFEEDKTPDPAREYKVTYEFKSGTDGKELPKEVTKLLPAEQTGKKDGTQVVPTEPVQKEVKTAEGTWTFKGYDKKDATINGKDEHFVGKWEFTPKTPTTEVVTEYVDENGKTIAPKQNGKQTNKDIEGYEFVRTETDDKGNTKHIYKKKTTPSPAVETRYVDTEGKQILADKAGTHDPSTIEGYQFVRTDNDKNGNIIHVYKKIAPAPKIETRYVDENGNQLLPPKEGEQGSVAIDGYNYIRTSKDNDGNIIHIYSKTPFEGVETRYVDTDGNQILADKTGTHDPSNIEGYQFVKTTTDENGNTIHVYKKIAPAPKVETRYVDEKGNQLLLPKEGTQAQKTIKGYEFVRTKTDKDGNTVHIYKKKTTTPTTDVVTEYVDENGNTIATKVNGKQPNKYIDGYEFVRTTTDKNGNTKHIYKKKTTTTPTTDVVTEYVDENGNTIATKVNGTKPNKYIDGYEFVKTETDENGNTKHIYKKKTTTTPTTDVVTEYVDEKCNIIATKEIGTK
ncbi:SHIRT domain-containing protein, partial [Anaerococcus hydrogenalis]|uniref:SHIRT domain-containing protein n=1 Tax=Anaerococcus hydrogenalis TaxID=33029 RepID=UPI001DDA60DE